MSTFDADALAAGLEAADGDCMARQTAIFSQLNALEHVRHVQSGLAAEAVDALATAACDTSSTVAGENAGSMDVFFLLICAYLVFLMQAGFAMLCAGSVRTKNTMNILLKNVLDACVGAMCFYVFGYGFAYGDDDDNSFIGSADFALKETQSANDAGWAGFLFQWAFSAAAATIVSGSVAERTTFGAYLGYSAFLTSFVYPVVVHWVWDGQGWLSAFNEDPLLDIGMIDFAGSGVVHMTGGIAGLMGAAIVGPRVGRFDAEGNPADMHGHSASMAVLGTFLLWFGWYGFNPGSMLAIAGLANASVVGRTAVTTTFAAASAGVTSLFLKKILGGYWDLLAVCNGLLAGLVAVTAPCPVIEPWAAILCGFGGAIVFIFAEKLLLMLKIDDPLSAAPLHGFAGAFGVLYVGLMAYKPYVTQAYGFEGDIAQGVFYGGNGKLLACQIIGILAITAWVGVLLGAFFGIMKVLGLLRVSESEEMAGLDVSKHGGVAMDDMKAQKPTGM